MTKMTSELKEKKTEQTIKTPRKQFQILIPKPAQPTPNSLPHPFFFFSSFPDTPYKYFMHIFFAFCISPIPTTLNMLFDRLMKRR